MSTGESLPTRTISGGQAFDRILDGFRYEEGPQDVTFLRAYNNGTTEGTISAQEAVFVATATAGKSLGVMPASIKGTLNSNELLAFPFDNDEERPAQFFEVLLAKMPELDDAPTDRPNSLLVLGRSGELKVLGVSIGSNILGGLVELFVESETDQPYLYDERLIEFVRLAVREYVQDPTQTL
jgi:hypothetical protein